MNHLFRIGSISMLMSCLVLTACEFPQRNLVPGYSDYEYKYEIMSMSLNIQTEGSGAGDFIFYSTKIDEVPYLYFYKVTKKTKDNGETFKTYTLDHIRADDVELIMTDEVTPCIARNLAGSKAIYGAFCPVGTITEKWDANLPTDKNKGE